MFRVRFDVKFVVGIAVGFGNRGLGLGIGLGSGLGVMVVVRGWVLVLGILGWALGVWGMG